MRFTIPRRAARVLCEAGMGADWARRWGKAADSLYQGM